MTIIKFLEQLSIRRKITVLCIGILIAGLLICISHLEIKIEKYFCEAELDNGEVQRFEYCRSIFGNLECSNNGSDEKYKVTGYKKVKEEEK
ncbi:MAG: hypothetical protein Q4E47_01205 [Candidatus Saccharibacteria bacterium]|nr:hypothetical protein [Candidatus Saccharibacteria bacterium]